MRGLTREHASGPEMFPVTPVAPGTGRSLTVFCVDWSPKKKYQLLRSQRHQIHHISHPRHITLLRMMHGEEDQDNDDDEDVGGGAEGEGGNEKASALILLLLFIPLLLRPPRHPQQLLVKTHHSVGAVDASKPPGARPTT